MTCPAHRNMASARISSTLLGSTKILLALLEGATKRSSLVDRQIDPRDKRGCIGREKQQRTAKVLGSPVRCIGTLAFNRS